MLRNLIILSLAFFICIPTALSKTDKSSAEYLKNKKHFSIFNPVAEAVVQKTIKKSLKKSTGENFKVKFDGYTLYSMKNGVFKNLELEGDDFQINGINVEYLKLKSLTNYNKIDYKQNPVSIVSDMVYAYEIHLTEKSLNQALETKEYKEIIEKINSNTYPFLELKGAFVNIKNDKLKITLEYNIPIAPSKKDKKIKITTGLKVERNKIAANDLSIDSSYGKLPADKITNLINILDPLTFTLDLMNTKNCNVRTENVKIIDNIIQINGKMYVKGGGK